MAKGAAPDLEPYRQVIETWMPKAALHAEIPARNGLLVRLDGVLTWKTDGKTIRYIAEAKRNFRFQDAGVIVEQLNRLRAALPKKYAGDKLLLLAPHVRAQQAAVLERAGIDYVDLAGNAHLQVPGLFVHVEGRRPAEEPVQAIRRPHKAWIKTVMALLVQPALVQAPYRTLAEQAAVALGTVPACMNDLTARGLLLDGRQGRKLTDRPALVALWVQAYVEALRPKLKERRFQIRANGKEEVWNRLQTILAPRHQPWALTGADAAERLYALLPHRRDRDLCAASCPQRSGHAKGAGRAACRARGQSPRDRTTRPAGHSNGEREGDSRRARSARVRRTAISRHTAGARSGGAASAHGSWRCRALSLI